MVLHLRTHAQTLLNGPPNCDSLAVVPAEMDFAMMTDSTRFKPVFLFAEPDTYSFKVYDRGGVIVFSTDIVPQGWNGCMQNRRASIGDGTYVWEMECVWNADSVRVACKGFVVCRNMQIPFRITALDTLSCQPGVWVPNAFTPNGDSANDEFLPQFGCPPIEYSLEIFDRWGELIFSTTDPNDGWDATQKGGANAPVGVYVWRIKFRAYEGDKPRKLTGQVTLVR